MDTDVIPHGNLNFFPNTIISYNKNDGVVLRAGNRIVLLYVIHKTVLNAVEQMYSLEKK